MEDHDLSRNRAEYEPSILSDLHELGFVPNEGISMSYAPHPSPYRQSDCAEDYEAQLHFLAKKGLVYGCECSRKQIQSRQQTTGGELCYDGTCAGENLPLQGHTVRFRIPPEAVDFEDQLCGKLSQLPRTQCGDFSLRDRTGQWTYQFCCVCDDIRQGIDLVVRGEDLLASTGRQIQLFHALGHSPPRYAHHPLLCDENGEKLSKRQYSASISQQREAGISTEKLIGRATFLAGIQSQDRPLKLDQALALFAARLTD
jgi:glutamyl-tRNA synthetase/glutamyl-Q tRNA(Asp) synthetase